MRALQFDEFGGPEVLHVADVPEPVPGDGQLRVAVRAVAVNPYDTKVRQGMFGGDLPKGTGMDVAGVTDAGEAVFGQASGPGAAEVAILANWARKPDSLSFEEAAGYVTACETAVRCLDTVGVKEGDVVAIAGAAGGVGSAAVQFAVARGARVIGTASEGNHDYLRELGAEPVAHGGIGDVRMDAGIDTAGRGAAAEMIERCDRVVTIADYEPPEGVRLTTRSSAWHALAEAAALHEQGRFSLPVAGVFSFEDAAEAHRRSETGHTRGKLILVP